MSAARERRVRVEVTTHIRPSPNPLPEGEGFIDKQVDQVVALPGLKLIRFFYA